jgi:hypothetical protein
VLTLAAAGLVAWCTVANISSDTKLFADVQPALDHAKPWYTRDGARGCASKEDLAIFRENAALQAKKSLQERKLAACWGLVEGQLVVEVDHDGSFQPDYLVRTESGRLAWVPSYFLRN